MFLGGNLGFVPLKSTMNPVEPIFNLRNTIKA
jgi:hypothetical protein